MVSKYDVLYVIAKKGEMKANEIVEALGRQKDEYGTVFNHIMELEKDGYAVRRKGMGIRLLRNTKSEKMFVLISFCINNSMNYNLMFKKSMLEFLSKASRKEFFTIRDIKIHPQTFKFYISLLAKYGFMLIVSRNPLKCKLLRHHFIIDLMGFFGKKPQFYAPKQRTLINEIKKELVKYRRNLKIHYTVIEDLENKDEAHFIYTSLNMEGNPLTLPETQKLILEEIVPEKRKLLHINEVTNYKKAVDMMKANSRKKINLSLGLILEYHKTSMSHIQGAGKIRKHNVRIKFNPSFKTCDWNLIHLKLDELMNKYDGFESKKQDIDEIISFASFFHNEFQRIHPFTDGNSRISRLLMMHILRSHGVPIMDLPLGYFDIYLDLTKRSKKRDDKAFRYLIEEITLMNLKRLNNAVRV